MDVNVSKKIHRVNVTIDDSAIPASDAAKAALEERTWILARYDTGALPPGIFGLIRRLDFVIARG